VATNDYTVGSNSTIIKSGYVTLESSDGSKMTVSFDKLGLSGKAEDWLNRELRVIYTEKGGVLDIIGCAFRGKNVAAESVSFASDHSYVTINGIRYRVVETKSDSLSTNANELVVHMFGSDSALVPLKSVSELKNAMGFGTLTLIFDKSNSETASAAILKNATFGQLDITKDKINLAGGLKASQLTGGFLNEVKAESGDFVLYYFNSGNKSLEILEKLEISEKGLLTQLTSTSAVIGGKTYTLGMANSGVSASDIHSALMAFGLGKEVRVVAKNGVILAVLGADDVVKSDSSYLVALSQPVPVYTGGMLRYVMSASVDGITQDIFVDLTSVNVGKVYRYVKTADGLHSLKAIGSSAFTQTGEIAEISDSIASDTEIKKDGNAFFAIGDKKFVTDKNSVILVNDGSGSFTFHKGDYAGIIKANATSDVVAVMRDEIGAVDTLIYLYVSNGTLSDAEAGGSSVKILSQAGFELADGKYYTLYTVFNFATGEKTTLRSLHSDLTVGSTYATDSEGRISSKAMSTTEGPVTGFTATTVTVGSSTFTLASDVAIKAISVSGTLSDLELDDLFMKKVELIKTGSVVKAILVKGDIAFTASYDSGAGKVKITADTDISSLTAALRSATKDGETIDVSSLTLSVVSPDIVIDSGAVASGEYAIVFTLNGTEYRVTLTV